MSVILFFIYVVAIIVIALFIAFVYGVPRINKVRLKRQARAKERIARRVWPLYQQRRHMTIGFGIDASFFLLLLTAIAVGTYGVIGALLIGGSAIVFGWVLGVVVLQPRLESVLSMMSPVITPFLAYTAPVYRWLQKSDANHLFPVETDWSRASLVQQFESYEQSQSEDLTQGDIKMLQAVLSMPMKAVREVMTPRRVVQSVAADDTIGPLLMDELHKSGHSRFPVVASAKDAAFVGTLYLRDLVGESSSKRISELMVSDVRYIHEEESLDYALRVFLKTKHHLFVVVNSFEEFVGVLSLEDVLEEVIGSEIIDEFDLHDDLRAVAEKAAAKDRTNRSS